jgi:hypothetical protein
MTCEVIRLPAKILWKFFQKSKSVAETSKNTRNCEKSGGWKPMLFGTIFVVRWV